MINRTFDKINLKFLQKSYETDTLTNVLVEYCTEILRSEFVSTIQREQKLYF